jgi:hypothetical protein
MKELRMGGTIVYRTKQACAYADDIALVGRNLDSLMKMFDTLERKSPALGLRINEEKTKYMKIIIRGQEMDTNCNTWKLHL